MRINWLTFHNSPYIEANLPLAGYLTLAGCALLVILLVFRSCSSFRLSPGRWLLFAACAAASLAVTQVMVIQLESLSAFGAIELAPLSLLPLIAAALWLGAGPAAIVGLLTGLSHALFTTGRITEPFEIAVLGIVLAIFMRQKFRGWFGKALRQPVFAALVGAVSVGWPLTILAIFTTSSGPAFASLERTTSLMPDLLLNLSTMALIGGFILQATLVVRPGWRPVKREDHQPAPWDQRLSSRIFYTFIPVSTLMILLLVIVTTGTAYRVATGLVVDQMARDAEASSGYIPFYVQVGRSLIRELSLDNDLTGTQTDLSALLAEELRAVPFFQQLIYLDTAGEIVAAYPETTIAFSQAEASRVQFALESGIPGEVTVPGSEEDARMSFITAVTDASGTVTGALVGRTSLNTNPMLTPVMQVLYEGAVGEGEGYIINSQNEVILYPAHPELQQEHIAFTGLRELPTGRAGQAFRQRQADGTRQIIYLLPITGRSDWSIIMVIPNEVALALALQIALPTLVLMILMLGSSLPLLTVLIRSITTPLEELAQAASRITQGDMDEALDIDSEDEIGRLGQVFEQMRIRLSQRLTEQQELFKISRSVSNSLEGYRAMQLIVGSALNLTDAAGARLVLLDADGSTRPYMAGDAATAMSALDRQLIDLVQRDGMTIISQLWRASDIDTANVKANVQALAALPLRSDRAFHGVLWLAYDHEHLIEPSEMTFLSTLAEQASIAAENIRLFGETEEGRRKLEAVLESTADGMIVVNNEGRITLINPAAESYFGVRAEQVVGRRASDVISIPTLSNLLTDLQAPASNFELPSSNGHTFMANTSPIVSHSGSITGRVTVLRDVTTLKTLDNFKTIFLRIVSHDLRSPLTYMKLGLAMMREDGPLNDAQQENAEKIAFGIEYIKQFTERLTYLSRLDFGDEAELSLALLNVRDVLKSTITLHERRAQMKKIKVHIRAEPDLPPLYADDTLYRQAISNLIDNALKYAPENSTITVRAFKEDDEHLAVSVSDTGVGIRPEDQGQLFELFYRVPYREGDPPPPTGSGIGLALVKAIADAHRGHIGVESEFGEGSTFTFSVPIRRP